MTQVGLGFMTQASIVRLLMSHHGYTQQAAVDAVDHELPEVWLKLPAGHETTLLRVAGAVAALRLARSDQVRRHR